MAKDTGRILVVDDNRLNRIKLSRNLELQGHRVSLAESGQQALDMLQADPPDVVLLDIIMPGMNGYEVLQHIKSSPELRDIPVIVISALDEVESAVRCIEIGAEDYLPKPFNPVLLRARLNASLQKKRLRDLEKAYLQQELMLRQSEKLATLGKLTAGMAHELNNPAAAVQRGGAQLREAVSLLQRTHLQLASTDLGPPQIEALLDLDGRIREMAKSPLELDPLARSDREYQLETWLEERGIQNAWQIAPALVNLGYSGAELAPLLSGFTPLQYTLVVEWINCTSVICDLLFEISQGVGRIAQIVKALKAYTYLDQAPIQAVNVHESLDNTLIVLRGKLTPEITVRREYCSDLPVIQAYGGELNQVWTNIIDNALDALAGSGQITLRTICESEWVTVAIEDDGPGIPEAILGKIFDPFFTTKPPGAGAGLGLSIAHSIVAQKHKGRMDVTSQPGRTRFEVRLPTNRPLDAS